MTLAEALANPINREWHVKTVVHSRVEAYKAAGWTLTPTLQGCHHGYWAEAMEWRHDGPPVEPPAPAPSGTTAHEEAGNV